MKKLLLIEDNNELRENTAEILELAGYEVHSAENGKKGVELALKEIPELIICDIMMPELDGYGVIHLLNKNESTKNIPFIFLTAKTEKSDLRKGMELGADDYITKPFNDIELLTAIEIRLKKTEALKKSILDMAGGFNGFIENVRTKDEFQLTGDLNETYLYKRKMQLYTAGKNPHFVYYIISGKVKTSKVNDDGKELITGIYGSGDFLGYLAVLEGRPYSENAEIIEDAEIMQIQEKDFQQLMNNDLAVSAQFIKLLANNVSSQEEKLITIAYHSLRKRIAIAIIDLYDKFKDGGGPEKQIEISRENLAHLVGTAKESLIRTLSDFKDEGLITLEGSRINLLNEKKLRDLPY